MEYIAGKHLKDAINDPSVSPLAKGGLRGVLDIAMQIAKGLHAAHKKGIVHRDIKSANIMSRENGHIKSWTIPMDISINIIELDPTWDVLKNMPEYKLVNKYLLD